MKMTTLPLNSIDIDPGQPRLVVDAALKDLSLSILREGVIQPILVRPAGERYRLVCGERRLRACEMAGLTEIPAIIRDLDDTQAREIQLVENGQRRGLSDVDWGRAIRDLYERLKNSDQRMSWNKVGMMVGLTRERIHQLYSLAYLPAPILEMLASGLLSGSHGLQLARLKQQLELQQKLREQACKASPKCRCCPISVADLRSRIDALLGEGNGGADRLLRELAPIRRAIIAGLDEPGCAVMREALEDLLGMLPHHAAKC
ncbi:MAG TPA: ParB/RepB/Spo0J family partition protein [Armatimonadota bacterium]|nr:ParB/RepB/Spo0J family partition protein [Armatimonadota bacterium]